MPVGAAGRVPVRPEPPEGWRAWLAEVYRRLLGAFGPRHWWPSALAPSPARAEPFEMIAGAILVQNVAWSNAAKAVQALAGAGLLDVAAMAAAPVAEVERLIRPAAYFRQKARRLKGFAAYVTDRYGGDLAAMLGRPLADLRPELLSLSGIGPETADCILCYAAGHPVMAMDAYTRRIFSRLGVFAPDVRYHDMQAFFHAYTPADAGLRGEFHALIDTLGSRLCLKREPHCGECPLADLCGRVDVPAQGEPVRIVFKDKKHSSGTIRDGEIVLYISSRLSRAEQARHIEELTRRLLPRLARARRLRQSGADPTRGLTPSPVTDDAALARWAREINERHYGFPMGQVRFRRQTSRWGSCSTRTRNIQISHRLRGGPHELLEYVLIHEIAHLGEPNHSPRFWALVERACPDWRERRRLLRRYEEYLRASGSAAEP